MHAPHQLPSPGKHCWAPWVRCSSFEDLRETQTSFKWKSVQWSYVSINSSKWSGKVKIVDLNKKSCSKLYKSMPTSIHFGSICLFWMKYLKIPKRWANLHTTKNVLASTLVLKPLKSFFHSSQWRSAFTSSSSCRWPNLTYAEALVAVLYVEPSALSLGGICWLSVLKWSLFQPVSEKCCSLQSFQL